jgi:hypothetical protein
MHLYAKNVLKKDVMFVIILIRMYGKLVNLSQIMQINQLKMIVKIVKYNQIINNKIN